MNSTKILQYIMLMVSYIMMMSSNNWLMMWMSLEINLISFIPLLNNKNNLTSQNMMIYFLVQTLSSIMFLFTIMNNNIMNININQFINMIMMLSLMMKIGLPPFHLWMIIMINKMSGKNLFLLLTLQKIIPMMIISMIMNYNYIYMIIFSSIISAISGINQTNLLKIMTYSSMNHSSWMLMSMLFESNMWIMYMIIYMIMMFMFCYKMNWYNIYYINQLQMNLMNYNKLIIIMLMLSIGGLPPFIGFLPKWMIMQMMINLNMNMMMIIMLMSSLIILFFYMQIIMNMFMMNYNMMKFNYMYKKNSKMNSMMLIINITMPIILMMNLF
uniref:NADH-ubiquinone oxidoreductase chain 2 n=1 Tax=Henschiella sp. PJ-2015 TaxID=1663422 RepID=A0A342D241_9HEMI|nr:NADH dehydrogenase subunit 2 [Henschiella sp. PJ-2015]